MLHPASRGQNSWRTNLSKASGDANWHFLECPFIFKVLSVWGLHVLTVHAWVLSGHSGFLPPSKNKHVRLIGDFKLSLGVSVALWWTGDPSMVYPRMAAGIGLSRSTSLNWIKRVWKMDGWRNGCLTSIQPVWVSLGSPLESGSCWSEHHFMLCPCMLLWKLKLQPYCKTVYLKLWHLPLAIFGSESASQHSIHISRPSFWSHKSFMLVMFSLGCLKFISVDLPLRWMSKKATQTIF